MTESELKSRISLLIETYIDVNELNEEEYSELLMDISELISEMGPH
jgi:hypothetical protein